MYFAILIDDYLSAKDNYSFKEIGHIYKAVIVESDTIPENCDYVQVEEDEAKSFRFVDVTAEKITVRPGGDFFEFMVSKGIEEVPSLNKLGEPLEGALKYKYTLTEDDRRLASQLKEKIVRFVNV